MDMIFNASELIEALTEMASRIGTIYGDRVYSVMLYGSYARGDQTADSDVDIAVIVKDGVTKKMHDDMINLVVDYELDLALTLSVVPIEYDNYMEWNRILPYYRNINREGIVLWKAA